MGVRIQEVTKEIAEVEKLKKPKGALVASVGEGSPADKSGIKAGDIILEFDGKEIDTMRTLPKAVANTSVGKNVQLKIWRNKKLITKRLTLGRLESSEEFKSKKKEKPKKTENIEIETLKITVRDINNNDIKSRKLDKGLKGSVILKIKNNSVLKDFLKVNDIIIEVQKKSVISSKNLENLVKNVKNTGQPLYLTVINNNNQRRYLGVKLK